MENTANRYKALLNIKSTLPTSPDTDQESDEISEF